MTIIRDIFVGGALRWGGGGGNLGRLSCSPRRIQPHETSIGHGRWPSALSPTQTLALLAQERGRRQGHSHITSRGSEGGLASSMCPQSPAQGPLLVPLMRRGQRG